MQLVLLPYGTAADHAPCLQLHKFCPSPQTHMKLRIGAQICLGSWTPNIQFLFEYMRRDST